MSFKHLKKFCHDFEFIGRAKLKRYKFVYDGVPKGRGGIYANIIPQKNRIVWGGLFKIKKKNLKALDQYEDYPEDYDRKFKTVLLEGKKKVKALLYFRPKQPIGTPSITYRNLILRGASDCQLKSLYSIKNH